MVLNRTTVWVPATGVPRPPTKKKEEDKVMSNYSKMLRLLGKYGFTGECKPYFFKGEFYHKDINGGHCRHTIHIYPVPTQGDESNRWECYQKNEEVKEFYRQQGLDPFDLLKKAIERVLWN